MNNPFDDLHVTANATGITPTSTAGKYAQGWAAGSALGHGSEDVVASAANSRLTLKPGIYLCLFNASVELEDDSTTSVAGVTERVTFTMRLDQVAITGAKATMQSGDVDDCKSLSIHKIVEVADGAVGQLEMYVESSLAAGSDVLVREAQFSAVRIG